MDEFVKLKVFMIIGAFFLFYNMEWLFPKAQNPYKLRDNLFRQCKNLLLFLLNSFLSPLIILPITLYAASHSLEWRPEWWHSLSLPLKLLINWLMLDFFIYWWHRANHEIAFLWRFHRTHHLDEFLDSTSAVRFHFGEVILSACVRGLFIMMMDIDLISVIFFETTLLIASIFQHSNVKLPRTLEYYLNFILVTPQWHWMHHHARQEDTDSHYGNGLTIWDRLFKSRAVNQRNETMKIGVQGDKDKNFIELLKNPFVKK